jgi:hypothetical protein
VIWHVRDRFSAECELWHPEAAPPLQAARVRRPAYSPDSLGAPHAGLGSVDPSRGYFPRAVFFFGFGFLIFLAPSGPAGRSGRG